MWYHVLYQAVSYLYKQNKVLRNKRARECSLQLLVFSVTQLKKKNKIKIKTGQ